MDDLSYVANTDKSSDCSSSDDGEKIVSEPLSDLSSHMVGLEQKYLSGLIFSVSPPFNSYVEKPYECEDSQHTESDSDGIYERDVIYHYEQSPHHGKLLDQVSMAIESQEPNWSCIVEGSSGGNSGSNPLDCDPEVSKIRAFKEGISCCRNTILMNGALPEELFMKDQQVNNIHSSELFKLKNWKVSSNNNFLSINPMLMKSTFLNLQTDPGGRDGTHSGKYLPYCDFSSVEDPCKGCMERLSAGNMDSSASAASYKSDLHDEQHCGQDVSIIKPKISHGNSLTEVKDYNKKDDTSTLVSGGSTWERLLRRSSNTVINGVGNHIESSLAKFDIPLDFIIDKCLLQEIMLQYPYLYAKFRSESIATMFSGFFCLLL